MLIFRLLFDFTWSSNKVFKDIKIFWTVYSRPFIRYQGKNLDCSEYDAVFNFSCIVSCNLTKVVYLLSLSYHFYHKNQTLNLPDSQLEFVCLWNIALYSVHKNAYTDRWNVNWLELFPWCLTFIEFIVSICNKLKFILIINTVSLSLTKI